jgi:hypothetical protein
MKAASLLKQIRNCGLEMITRIVLEIKERDHSIN